MPTMSTVDDNGDAAPETDIRAGMEIYKPALEASTGSTMIPLTQEEQVSHSDCPIPSPTTSYPRSHS